MIEPEPGLLLAGTGRRLVQLTRPATVEECFGQYHGGRDPDAICDETLWWIARDLRLKIQTFVSLDDDWVEADAITQLGALS